MPQPPSPGNAVTFTSFIFTYPLTAGGRWGTTHRTSTTSSLHFSLFTTALWNLANPRPVHSLMLSSHLFFFLSFFSVCLAFFPLSLSVAKRFWQDLMNGRQVHTTVVCVSLRWSGGLRTVRLPAGSWHRLGTYFLVGNTAIARIIITPLPLPCLRTLAHNMSTGRFALQSGT